MYVHTTCSRFLQVTLQPLFTFRYRRLPASEPSLLHRVARFRSQWRKQLELVGQHSTPTISPIYSTSNREVSRGG
ncbi:hypothetical protein LDENG_00079580 [Lucifuga dentata]|nr:hypothetical protein LDENG_00079580 [Lucifuga dentata]